MPNHFHMTVRQDMEDGIRQFIQRLSGSFAHYFSVKYKKHGHIFEDKYKAVHIENEEQLYHLSRYIHLNPVTSYLVKNPEDYPYSSYNLYLGKVQYDFIDPTPITESFKSPGSYNSFVLAQTEYQHTLDEIKHLLLE